MAITGEHFVEDGIDPGIQRVELEPRFDQFWIHQSFQEGSHSYPDQ